MVGVMNGAEMARMIHDKRMISSLLFQTGFVWGWGSESLIKSSFDIDTLEDSCELCSSPSFKLQSALALGLTNSRLVIIATGTAISDLSRVGDNLAVILITFLTAKFLLGT